MIIISENITTGTISELGIKTADSVSFSGLSGLETIC